MDQPLTYKSVLPAISIEFQDGSFLDVDDILGFTLSKTDDNFPQGVAIVDVRFGKRSWHSIKSLSINGQIGKLVAFDRFGHAFEIIDDEESSDDPYNYAKMIMKFDLSGKEMAEILTRRGLDLEFIPEGEEDESENSSPVLQRSGDSAETD